MDNSAPLVSVETEGASLRVPSTGQANSAISTQGQRRSTEEDDTPARAPPPQEQLEGYLVAIVCLAETSDGVGATPDSVALEGGTDAGRATRAGALAVASHLLSSHRKRTLAEPSARVLGSLLQLLKELEATRSVSCSATPSSQEGARSVVPSETERWTRATRTLEGVREALEIPGTPEVGNTPTHGSTAQRPRLPVGSGRAAATAAASGRGGILTSLDSPGLVSRDTVRRLHDAPAGGMGRDSVGVSLSPCQRGPVGSRRVPLSALRVADVSRVLEAEGWPEEALAFSRQAVDGAMLNDPHLCETDFLELGLGRAPHAQGDDCRGGVSAASLLDFFLGCQRDGVVLPPSTTVEPEPPQDHPREPSDMSAMSARAAPREIIRGDADETTAQLARGTDEEAIGAEGQKTTARGSWKHRSSDAGAGGRQVVADIPLEPPLPPRESDGPAGTREHSKRMSITLHRTLIVTAAGRDRDLASEVDRVEALEDDNSDGSEGARACSCGEPPNNPNGDAPHGRRSTLSVPVITLDVECNRPPYPHPTRDLHPDPPPQAEACAAVPTVHADR